MASVMIGIDPHRALHTTEAISGSEQALGEPRVRASAGAGGAAAGVGRGLAGAGLGGRGVGGLGHLLAQQCRRRASGCWSPAQGGRRRLPQALAGADRLLRRLRRR